jgi:hypothetical protein
MAKKNDKPEILPMKGYVWNAQGPVWDHYQLVASFDNVFNEYKSHSWHEKKFLVDLVDLYKKIQYKVYNVYVEGKQAYKMQFHSGWEFYQFVTETLNENIKEFSCNVYFDYNKKNIILLNNGVQYLFIPSITESKLYDKLTAIVESKLKEIKTPTNPADKNQLKIAIDTVKNPNKGRFLGGPTEAEAIEILKTKFDYTDKDIKKLQENKQSNQSIKK